MTESSSLAFRTEETYAGMDDEMDESTRGNERWGTHRHCSFLQEFIEREDIRIKFLMDEGKCHRSSPKSTSGWLKTLFVWKGRALDWVIGPWCFVTLHAIVYGALSEHIFYTHNDDSDNEDDKNRATEWQSIFTFALNTTMGFLLVFRLNRAAIRFWIARECWGTVISDIRNLISGLLIHGDHDPHNRDKAIRWILAYPLCTKDLLRGDNPRSNNLQYSGILSDKEITAIAKSGHPPSACILQLRWHIKEIFVAPDESTNDIAMAIVWGQHRAFLEEQVNAISKAEGAMERIQSTPLPLVYVSHLRTFLLINLILVPYIWGPTWGWYTVPIVAVVAFAFLGIEAAAAEVEIPFGKGRPNALDMDAFCLYTLANTKHQLTDYFETSKPSKRRENSVMKEKD